MLVKIRIFFYRHIFLYIGKKQHSFVNIKINFQKKQKNLKNLLTLKRKFSILTITMAQTNVILKDGRIAQLGEHLPYKQGVIGSSPIVPTIF